ncbi:MAG: phage tail tape measure protein [Eubacteriales bacterium]
MNNGDVMGLTMAVSGEKEFREALANINAALRVNETDLGLVTAQYANNKDSIEALTASKVALQDKITSETEKVKLLQEQTARYTTELGENDTKTLKWQAELNKAKTELIGLTNSLESNNAALLKTQNAISNTETETEKFNRIIDNLSGKLAVNQAELTRVTAEYRGNENSAEALSAKLQVLNEIYIGQMEKCNELTKELKYARQEYGNNSAEVDKLKISLNNAETAFYNTRYELDKATKSTVNAESETEKFNSIMNKLSDELELNESKTSLLNATYGKNADSSEALKKKTELLRDSIIKQEQAVTELEKALERASDEYGAGSSEVMEYEKKLIGAKTSLAGMNNELVENQGKIDGSTNKTEAFNGMLGKLSDLTGIQLPADMSKLSDSTGDMSIAMGGALTTVIGLVVALQKNMMDAANGVRELKKAADEASVTDQQMAALQYAEKITGITTDKMIDAYSKTTEFMKRAKEGNEEALAILDKFNISLEGTNGKLRNADDVFLEISGKLGEIEDGTTRNITAMGIFGEDAKSLYQIFDDGGEDMKGAIAEAWDTGIVKSDEYYEKLANAAEETAKFFAQINAFMGDIAIWWNDFTDSGTTFSETLWGAIIPGGGKLVGSLVDDMAPGEEKDFFSWDAIVNDIKGWFGGGDKPNVVTNTSDDDKNDDKNNREEEKKDDEENTNKIVGAIIEANSESDKRTAKFWAELPAAIEAGRGVYIDSYATGTNYVPKTGLYKLHEGEGVLTKEENKRGAGGNSVYNINISQPVESPYETALIVKRTMQQVLNET